MGGPNPGDWVDRNFGPFRMGSAYFHAWRRLTLVQVGNWLAWAAVLLPGVCRGYSGHRVEWKPAVCADDKSGKPHWGLRSEEFGQQREGTYCLLLLGATEAAPANVWSWSHQSKMDIEAIEWEQWKATRITNRNDKAEVFSIVTVVTRNNGHRKNSGHFW